MRPRNPDRRRVSGHRSRGRMGLNPNPWTASNPSSLTPATSLGSFLRLRAVAGLASYGHSRASSYDRSTADAGAVYSEARSGAEQLTRPVADLTGYAAWYAV